MYDLVIIGAGPGGYETAALAGKMKKKVALVEKEVIGGTCLNVGCIPTKTLLKSAKIFAECKEASLYGVSCGAPKIDMKTVQERKQKVITMLRKGVESTLKRSGVEVVKGHGRIAGKNVVEVNGHKLEAANILIASGSQSAVPPIPGIDSPVVLDSTKILELTEIPSSLAIIGGGVIGLEFACFFSEIGCKVTVIEMLPVLAPGIDSEFSAKLMQHMKKQGVDFHLSSKVMQIASDTVHFTDAGGAAQQIQAAKILNSTGRMPNIKDLGLEAAGVDFDRKGVKVTEQGKTNIPGIWACGDCTGRSLLAHSAVREGAVAANNMFGKPDRMRYHAVPGVVYTHPEIASVGKTEDALKAENIAYKKSVMPMAISGRFVVESEGKSGTIKVLAGATYGEILGVHIIGDPASEIIFGAASMIETEQTVEDIRQIIFPHPTVSEALKEAILHIE